MTTTFDKICNHFKKNYKDYLIILIVLLGIHLGFYILLFSKSLMNSDSSFIIDYANECLKYKTLFPKTWVNTNDFWIYSLIPMIIPLLKTKLSLFIARQIPVVIQTILLLFFTIDIHYRLLKNKKGAIYLLLILLAGVSGQFAFEVYGDATYGSIIFYMILSLWLVLNYIISDKKYSLIYLILLFIINIFINACSLRFPILIGAPLICSMLAFMYKNGYNKKHMMIIITMVASTIIGYIIHNIMVNNLIIELSYGDHFMSSTDDMISAIGNVLFNYFWITGSAKLNVFTLFTNIYNNHISNDSPLIVFSFILFIFSIVLLVIPVKLFKKKNKLDDNEYLIVTYILSFMVIMVFFLVIGGMWFWYRYITPVLFLLLFLIPIFYKYCFEPEKKNRIVFFIATCLICVSSLFMVFSSYFDMSNEKMRVNNNQGLTDFLLSKDLHFGYKYADGKEHSVYTMLSDGDLRIVNIRYNFYCPFKWLNSADWYKKDAYDGEVFFIRREDEPELDYEKDAIKEYTYNDRKIFVFENNDLFIENFKVFCGKYNF